MGRRSSEAQRLAGRGRGVDAVGDLRLGFLEGEADADRGADGAGAAGGAAKVRQGAGGVAAAGQPFSAVLRGGAEAEVGGLLAGVVVAGVADGGAVVVPAQAGITPWASW